MAYQIKCLLLLKEKVEQIQIQMAPDYVNRNVFNLSKSDISLDELDVNINIKASATRSSLSRRNYNQNLKYKNLNSSRQSRLKKLLKRQLTNLVNLMNTSLSCHAY